MGIFSRAGDEIGAGLGSHLSRVFGALDGSAARAQLQEMQAEYRRTADVEVESAARMEAALGRVEAAQLRLDEITAKYGENSSRAAAANVALADSHARAAKAQRDHVDAMVAAEDAHVALGGAATESATATSRAGQVFNAVGIASVAGYGAALFETTKKAGDFQAAQVKLTASAGESAGNLKAVSDGILQLAGTVGYSAQDLMNNMYGIEKAGYRGSDGVTVMRSAAQGAKSENAELGEVINGLTTSMNDFNFGAAQSNDVMSKMVSATSMAKTNFQQFSGALHTAEPLFANIGKSQGLGVEQMHHLMADLYGDIAQLTQSGDSADHAAETINHAMQKMLGPTAQMRGLWGSLGIDAQDVSDHLGERGLAGTLQMLTGALQSHTKNGKLDIDVQYQSAQAARAEADAFNALPAPAKAVADEIKNGTLSYKDFRKTRGGLDVEMANELNQWNNLNNKLTGYNDLIKSGIGDHISFDQALKILTGDQTTLQAALQLTGENTDKVNGKITEIMGSTALADGTVKGFNETQETLNAKMADAKAAFGAAAIEIGNAFVPFMTDAANIAKDVGDAMAKHPGILHAATDAVGAFGTAWLAIKTANFLSTVITPLIGGVGRLAAEEEGAAVSAGRLEGALGRLGRAGALAGLAQFGGDALQHAAGSNGFWHSAAVVGTDTATGAAVGSAFGPVGTAIGGVGGFGWGLYNQLAGHAAGGPLNAPGPKGRDSALFWGADGEHVWTADEVDAAGGHPAMYAMRRAVMGRQAGGAIGPDVAAAQSMAGAAYSQGARNDCSGMVGRVVEAATGMGGGLPTTQNMGSWLAERGFVPGIGGPGMLSVGWYNHGSSPNDGHAAMTLSDGQNAESGGSHGNFIVGPGAAGADASQFDHHMYLPNIYGQGAGGFGGMGGFSSAGQQRVQAASDRVASAQEKVAVAKEREGEVDAKPGVTQSQKDSAHNEVIDAERNLARAQNALATAYQSAASGVGRGGGRGGGLSGFGVPLPENFGLNKGLGGLAEWLVDFVGDLALAPAEGAMMRAAGMGGSPGGFADLGNVGTPYTASAFAAPYRGGYGAASAPGDVGADSGAPAQASGAGDTGTETTAATIPAPDPTAGATADCKNWYPRSDGNAAPAAPGPRADYKSWYPPSTDPYSGSNPFGVNIPNTYDPHNRNAVGPNAASDAAHEQAWANAFDALPHNYNLPVPKFDPGGSSLTDLNAWAAQHPGAQRWAQNPTYNVLPAEPIFGAEHHSGGGSAGDGRDVGRGPRGTDTVPAWLTPGEEVLTVPQAQAWRHAQYYAGGGRAGGAAEATDAADVSPSPAPKPTGPQTASGAPEGPGDDASKPSLPGGGIGGDSSTSSKGLSVSGGVLGAAEGAAAGAADIIPGAGAGVQLASQLMNRTLAYGGQMAGIAVQGILSTFLPSDSPLADFGNTLPGKILSAIAGAKPAAPQSAGNTQSPLKSGAPGDPGEDNDSVAPPGIGMQLNGVTIQASNPAQFDYATDRMQRQYNQHSRQYQTNKP